MTDFFPLSHTHTHSFSLSSTSSKGPGNPFGKKADVEVAQTYTWIQSHLEEDPAVSLPKHEVYDEYKCFCQSNQFEPLCVADFGKAMKHIFPKVKPRRLGQRGNSRYCYSGLRKKANLLAPSLPDLSGHSDSILNRNNDLFSKVRIAREELFDCQLFLSLRSFQNR